MYDIQAIRQDFPILAREVYGRPLVYLDNAATTQKPKAVIDAIAEEYCSVNANVHRGVHFLSQEATTLHENARETVRRFINAGSTSEIIFTRHYGEHQSCGDGLRASLPESRRRDNHLRNGASLQYCALAIAAR